MDIRDAVEADAGRLASLIDIPSDVMRNLVHDRTVRVAQRGEEIVGFVSYDAREDTVYVTQLEGTPDTYDALLAEPVGFARTEGMTVDLLVPESEAEIRTAATDAGFERTGTGPRFEGESTTRYRIDP